MVDLEHPDDQQLATTQPIIIFDGVCGLCNRSVDIVLKHDDAKRFLFAPSQSEVGRRLLDGNDIDPSDVDTLYLYDDGTFYDRSTAAIRIAAQLQWPWKAASAAWLIPRPVRNGVYRVISKNRYRWFGKRDACRIPTPAEQDRFLS